MIEFRKPTDVDLSEIEAYKREFQEAGSTMDGTSILCNVSAEEWLTFSREMEHCTTPRYVSALQYGLFDSEQNRLLGLLQIRLELRGYLTEFGGHIGYCVRPSERRKGYAKRMLRSALEICRERGMERVLITCLEDNIGSAKTIEACGGKYEKTVFDAQNYQANLKRYWIDLTSMQIMSEER